MGCNSTYFLAGLLQEPTSFSFRQLWHKPPCSCSRRRGLVQCSLASLLHPNTLLLKIVMRLVWLVVMVVLSMVMHSSNAMKEDTALAMQTNCRWLILILIQNYDLLFFVMVSPSNLTFPSIFSFSVMQSHYMRGSIRRTITLSMTNCRRLIIILI